MDEITAKIKEQPDIAEFELGISISALSRKLTKLKLTLKKRHFSPKNSSEQTYSESAMSG